MGRIVLTFAIIFVLFNGFAQISESSAADNSDLSLQGCALYALAPISSDELDTYVKKLEASLDPSAIAKETKAGTKIEIQFEAKNWRGDLELSHPSCKSGVCNDNLCCSWKNLNGFDNAHAQANEFCTAIAKVSFVGKWKAIRKETVETESKPPPDHFLNEQHDNPALNSFDVAQFFSSMIENPLGSLQKIITFNLLVLLTIFFVLLPVTIWKNEKKISGKHWFSIVGLVMLAFLLRKYLGLWAYFHDFNHGPDVISKIEHPFTSFYRSTYGQGYWVFHWIFQGDWIDPEVLVFAVNMLVSSLTVLIVVLSAKRLWKADYSAWLPAALFASLMPVAIKCSASEITMSLYGFFEITSLYLLLLLIKKRSFLNLLTLSVSLFITIQIRETAVILLPFYMLAIFLFIPRSEIVKNGKLQNWQIIYVALCSFIVLPFVTFVTFFVLPEIAADDMSKGFYFFNAPLEIWWLRFRHYLFIDPAITPPFVAVLVLLGFIQLCKYKALFAKWYAALLAFIILLDSLKAFHATDHVLFHGHQMPLLALLSGGAALFLSEKFPNYKRQIVFLICVLLLSMPVLKYDWITSQNILQKEYHLEKQMPENTKQCTFVIPVAKDDPYFPPITEYRPTSVWLNGNYIFAADYLAKPFEPYNCLIFVRSSTCYTFSFSELGFDSSLSNLEAHNLANRREFENKKWVREECTQIMQDKKLVPIISQKLENPEWINGVIPEKSIEIGYYWIKKPD